MLNHSSSLLSAFVIGIKRQRLLTSNVRFQTKQGWKRCVCVCVSLPPVFQIHTQTLCPYLDGKACVNPALYGLKLLCSLFLRLLCQNTISIQPLFSLPRRILPVQMTLTCLRLKLSLLGSGAQTHRPAEWNRVGETLAYRGRHSGAANCTVTSDPGDKGAPVCVRVHMCVPARAHLSFYLCALCLLHTLEAKGVHNRW